MKRVEGELENKWGLEFFFCSHAQDQKMTAADNIIIESLPKGQNN